MTLKDECQRYGLYFDTYNPGDGVTRYRFYTQPNQNYFEHSGIATLLGRKEASLFAQGFCKAVAFMREQKGSR